MIALASTSNTILNKNNSGHPCFVPDLRRKIFQTFTAEPDVNCFCHIWLLLCWSVFLLYPICWGILSWKNAYFIKYFFHIYYHTTFIFYYINVVYQIYWFHMLNHFCISEINPFDHYGWSFFCHIGFVQYFVEYFLSIFIRNNGL